MAHGELILPEGVQAYNERRRQAFECLCAMLFGDRYVFIKISKIGNETWAICDECNLQGIASVFCFTHYWLIPSSESE